MIVSVDSVPVWKLAVSEAVIVPAGDQFAAVDQFLFAPPPVHVNVSAHDGEAATTQIAAIAARIVFVPILISFLVFVEDWVCAIIRGVVSDAVSCHHAGIICDLPFNVVGFPKKMGGMIAHPSVVRQSPRAAFSGRELPYADGKLRVSPAAVPTAIERLFDALAFSSSENVRFSSRS